MPYQGRSNSLSVDDTANLHPAGSVEPLQLHLLDRGVIVQVVFKVTPGKNIGTVSPWRCVI
jgi:hypothetical protein